MGKSSVLMHFLPAFTISLLSIMCSSLEVHGFLFITSCSLPRASGPQSLLWILIFILSVVDGSNLYKDAFEEKDGS